MKVEEIKENTRKWRQIKKLKKRKENEGKWKIEK